MSQCMRAALWVPTSDPVVANLGILSNSVPGPIDAISTRFAAVSGGSGGGGIEEAPVDGKQYARKDLGWTEVGAPSVFDGGTF